MWWSRSKEKELQRDLARDHIVAEFRESGDFEVFIVANGKLPKSQKFSDSELAKHIKSRFETEFLDSGNLEQLNKSNGKLPDNLKFTEKELAQLFKTRKTMLDASQEIKDIEGHYIKSGDDTELRAFNARHLKVELLSGKTVMIKINQENISEWDKLRGTNLPNPDWAAQRAPKNVVIQFEMKSNPQNLMQAIRSEFPQSEYTMEKLQDHVGDKQYQITMKKDGSQITITEHPWGEELTIHVDVKAKGSEQSLNSVVAKLSRFAASAAPETTKNESGAVKITRDDTNQLGKMLEQPRPLPRTSLK